MSEILVETRALTKYFYGPRPLFSTKRPRVTALDEVSLSIERGETLGLVGESGCGKSTLGRTILRLIDPSSGQVFYDGKDITAIGGRELLSYRKKMQIVFQDPYSSLNPRMTVFELIAAPLQVFKIGNRKEQRERVGKMMELVGLDAGYMNRFPHEFSGGQRQRIGIARALILEPEFVVCDEAVSALDVSVRAQVLNLLRDLQKQMNLTLLFISHDLSVIRHMSDRIAVMYLGRIVEVAPKKELYEEAWHPYTRGLLSAVPIPDVHRREWGEIPEGEIPDVYHLPEGCHYRDRCPLASERCLKRPELSGSGHLSACVLGRNSDRGQLG